MYSLFGFYRKVSKFTRTFHYCYCFWLVFIPYFRFPYSIRFAYFPMNILFNFITSFFILCVSIRQTVTYWSIDSVFCSYGQNCGIDNFFYHICQIVSRWKSLVNTTIIIHAVSSFCPIIFSLRVFNMAISSSLSSSSEFFTSALADGLSLESEWQQVSTSLQDSSQYYCHSQ